MNPEISHRTFIDAVKEIKSLHPDIVSAHFDLDYVADKDGISFKFWAKCFLNLPDKKNCLDSFLCQGRTQAEAIEILKSELPIPLTNEEKLKIRREKATELRAQADALEKP